ncbi:unnamed protein product [Phaedon cochleariae]|uniref:Phosphorylated adapter RNA export protein n=1 Tax=Phaedon cochleariae TaxID=80249 RepID=A0A9P0DDB6_PHACE|nr:unnamed protein product [Phaedon cochleariae]
MDQCDTVLEEGEIANASDEDYTPLERPANYSCSLPQPRLPLNLVSESEEEWQSSDSSSDSDSKTKNRKKPKIKLRPPVPSQPTDDKRKKYDIWSTRLEGENLSETLLNSLDVIKKDRSRFVESYDYTLAYKYYENQTDQTNKEKVRTNNKRTRDDRNNVNFRQRKRSSSIEKIKGTTRSIPNLKSDINSTAEELAKDIANKLCEEKEDLILKVINSLGKKRAIDIFEETKQVEEDGGMLIMNQKRRRTPGGVYLFLVRNDYHITFDQKNEIFGEERQKHKQMLKAKQKAKTLKLKSEIAAARAKCLPDLLTRAKLLASQNSDRKVKDDNEETDFVNPPPTPETDGHENSGDGMDVPSTVSNGCGPLDHPRRQLNVYEEDFLDIGTSADMDLF